MTILTDTAHVMIHTKLQIEALALRPTELRIKYRKVKS